jgi:hypothetical protein
MWDRSKQVNAHNDRTVFAQLLEVARQQAAFLLLFEPFLEAIDYGEGRPMGQAVQV